MACAHPRHVFDVLYGAAHLDDTGEKHVRKKIIKGNPALSSLAGITGFDGVEQLEIVGNDALVELDVPVVGTTRSVIVERNASLEHLSAPASFSVSEEIVIILNPVLPRDHAVEWANQVAGGAATLKVDGNMGDSPNGSDCPWTDDYTCDEPDLCAMGSDVADCEVRSE